MSTDLPIQQLNLLIILSKRQRQKSLPDFGGRHNDGRELLGRCIEKKCVSYHLDSSKVLKEPTMYCIVCLFIQVSSFQPLALSQENKLD
jgi:hypothetical protein